MSVKSFDPYPIKVVHCYIYDILAAQNTLFGLYYEQRLAIWSLTIPRLRCLL